MAFFTMAGSKSGQIGLAASLERGEASPTRPMMEQSAGFSYTLGMQMYG